MKTSKHLTHLLAGTMDLMGPPEKELTFQNWEEFQRRLQTENYLNQPLSLFIRERGWLGMPRDFLTFVECAKMAEPTLKEDQTIVTFPLQPHTSPRVDYDIRLSHSNVRPVRFSFSPVSEGFYIVERENSRGNWRTAREHLFVPTLVYDE